MLKPNLIFETNQIIVFQQQLGPWDNLNHLFVCKSTKKACIVDPFDGEYWHDFCSSHGFQLSEIWLTHSHWDHVKGVEELVNITSDNIVIRCHILEQERGYKFNGISWWQHQEFTEITQSFGAIDFAIHCTPGHTPGHVTIIGNGLVITGDCLFLGRCGRTDLFGGSQDKQRQSLLYLRDILLEVEDTSLVLPGHQYELSDGSNPTTLKLVDLMANNEALNSIDDEAEWNNLPFLSFEDDLSKKAKRQKARNS